jgi:hypothetical protein
MYLTTKKYIAISNPGEKNKKRKSKTRKEKENNNNNNTNNTNNKITPECPPMTPQGKHIIRHGDH